MNNELDIIRVIDRTQLNEEKYFESLIEQAHSKGIIATSDIERVQYECLNLLAYKTERYNAGDSSSIQIEKAQALMSSIFFTIGLWLKTYSNPDDAIIALQNETVEELYKKGRKQIDMMVTSTKAIHTNLLKQLVDIKNCFYRSTIKDGILGFFKLYYPDYFAHEIYITADYPLFNPIPRLAGIEFIKAYVDAAYYENQFCAFFPANNIHHLLCGYEEDYQELLINIYEFVLMAAIGCAILEEDVCQLDIGERGTLILAKTFAKKSRNEIVDIIKKAIAALNSQFQFSQGLFQFVKSSVNSVVSKIEIALRENTLNRVFCNPAYPENNPKIIFSFGDKMDDEVYRKVIEQIAECRFSQDKISIIKNNIHSLADLEDTLLDSDMTESEVQTILRELSLIEIAAFSKKYYLQSDIEEIDLHESEQLLRQRLQRFILAMLPMEQKMIKQAETALQEE